MAPLQSYTTSFYRQAHAMTFGKMDKYFTPFFEDSDTDISTLEKHPELLASLNNNLSVVPQVASNSSEFLLNFSNKVSQLGYTEINLNMGCPFPMLVKRKKGGGLLAQPEMAEQMLDNFFSKTTNIKLSLKIRLGVDDKQQGRTIVELANQFPLEEIIIHPRLVTQKYSGEVNWDEFELLHTLSSHPVVANGDINSPEDAQKITKRFPNSKGLMLGRGLLTNPGLPELIAGKSDNKRLFHLHENYFELLTDYYSNWNQAFNFLQTFWYYPLQTNQELMRHLRKLKKHNKPELYQEWIEQLKTLSL
jgi:tRNA-dihydrouridine synthase